jgi:hypothetical protein
MSSEEARYRIKKLKARYYLLRGGEIILLSSAVALVIGSVLYLLPVSSVIKLSTTIGLGVAFVISWIIRYQLFQLTDRKFIQYLNAHYPQLEESADLLLTASTSLSGLQSLQLQKVLQRFDEVYPEIKLPNRLIQSVGACVVCMAAYLVLTSFVSPREKSSANNATNLATTLVNQPKGSAAISFLSISVSPPDYTRLKSFGSPSSNLKVPEGSAVTWSVEFSDSIKNASLLLSGKDSVVLTAKNNSYSTTLKLKESGFYQIQWHDDKTISSDYFRIEIVNDQSPKITIDNLNQFTKLSFADKLTVPLKATLSDDYGLTRASIIATVSKGSGESVKFREEKLMFETPTTISGKNIQASRTLDLRKLGLEAGDELYFYVEASDNKTPSPNYSRTETFFIALQDTTRQEAVEDEGLGVDLMPDYFRSQRQLIIDTEKLLKERKQKTVQEFKSISNELGYDQKVLRLRYGQFLGEEFEGQIGPVSHEEEEDDHESTIEKFSHVHDKENEHNLVADKKPTTTDHSHEEQKPGEKEDPLAAFAHNHDDSEQATFFIQSVRAKLKAALTVMWDAELHLRLYEPAKSLPYQYTALKLLKEISNDSRIYVHRTGFDPPPLKEEKRLTADLSEVFNSVGNSEQLQPETYPEIRKALMLMEVLQQEKTKELSALHKEQLHRAGQELAVVAVAQPGQYLEGLSLLKKLTDDTVKPSEVHTTLNAVQKIFWKVVPPQSLSPGKKEFITHGLDEQFLNSLEQLQHE